MSLYSLCNVSVLSFLFLLFINSDVLVDDDDDASFAFGPLCHRDNSVLSLNII